MAKLLIPRCNITKVFHAEKSGKDYLTIEDGQNTFNISSGDLDLTKVPTLVPVSLEIEIAAFVYGRNQGLRALSFKATPVQ